MVAKSAVAKNAVDMKLLQRAVTALEKVHEKTLESQDKQSLLGDDAVVQVQLGLEIAPVRPSVKPKRIAIPHPIFSLGGDGDGTLDEPEVCLIVKDESKPWVQQMIKDHSKHMKFIKKVLTLGSLRKKHSQFSQRRELLNKFSVFMADDRILPMLTKSLGKDFFKAKKQPIPITLTRKEALPLAIVRALSSTFMTLAEGTCVTIRVGSTGMPSKAVLANIAAAVNGAVDKIPRKWANIRSISIKTPASVALPFYNKTPEELCEIAKLASMSSAWQETKRVKSEDDQDVEMKEAKKKKRKLVTKSPLVRALKKQKEEEEKEKETSTAKKKESTPPKGSAKKEKKVKAEVKPDSDEPASQKRTKKTEEKTPTKSAEKVKKSVEKTPKKSVEKKAKKTEETPKKTPKKEEKDAPKKTEEKTPTKSAEKKVKKSAEKTPKTTPKKEEKDAPKKAFMSARKYTGSKKGYVFRRSKEGLGYHLDKPPVVDKMALEALTRSTNSKKSKQRGGRSQSPRKGKGRRR